MMGVVVFHKSSNKRTITEKFCKDLVSHSYEVYVHYARMRIPFLALYIHAFGF